MTDAQESPLLDDMEEPVDPDIALITDYFTRELTEAEAEQVEDRIADDAEFYRKVSPIIGMYTSDLDFPRMVAELDAREAREARDARDAGDAREAADAARSAHGGAEGPRDGQR